MDGIKRQTQPSSRYQSPRSASAAVVCVQRAGLALAWAAIPARFRASLHSRVLVRTMILLSEPLLG